MVLLPTHRLLRLHRYVGLAVAPIVLFFAVSGVWQIFRLQQSRKDGSYVAPPLLTAISDIHKVEGMGQNRAALPFKLALASVGGLLAFSTLLGIVAALRVTRPRWVAVLLLVAGVAIPAVLLLVADLGGGAAPAGGP